MFLSSSFGGDWVVEGPVPHHGEQDVAAPPGESDQGLVVALSLADLALVIGAGDRVQRLVELLNHMEKDLNSNGLFSDLSHGWPFVDWSPGMHSYYWQTRMATQFEYYQAFKNAAYLLRVLHDDKNAKRMAAEAVVLKAAAQKYMLDAHGTFGDRWQPNAYAVLSGVANTNQYSPIWRHVLSHVGEWKYLSYVISPYYNFYVVTAMAKMGHRRAALHWIREFGGGMAKRGRHQLLGGLQPHLVQGISVPG